MEAFNPYLVGKPLELIKNFVFVLKTGVVNTGSPAPVFIMLLISVPKFVTYVDFL